MLKAHSQKMEKKKKKLVVVFRWSKQSYAGGGEVTALFPYLPADDKGHCTSYVHVGQHGAADYSFCIDWSRPATPEEYAPLLKELRGIYDDVELVVKQRRPARS